MAIAKQVPLFIQCLLLAGSLSLVACGGGGGGSGSISGGASSSDGSTQKPSDSTPNAISFVAVTNAELNTKVSSPAVTISGIDIAAPVSISGGEYSINGGAFTSAAGSITNGQVLVVRLSSSDKTNTETSASVTVGGVSAVFSVTTAADVTPDSFTLTPAVDASLNTEYTSNTITVTGVDIAIPITISGGLYSINGGEFTATAGSVQPNQTIAVKATSGNRTELTHNAVLTIGGVSGIFAITTLPDTTAPVAEFKFPTPYTMSEANSVIVRGTAIDEHTIVSVKLVVSNNSNNTVREIDATPKSDTNGMKDFSSWTATIPLTAIAENDIKVVATDDRNNATAVANANKVTIRQANVRSAFPDTVNQIDIVNIVLDKYDGRNRALVVDSYGHNKQVLAVDFTTGSRTIAFTAPDCSLFALTIDPVTKHIYGVCNKKLYEFNLSDGALIGSYEITGVETLIRGMTLDRNNGRNRLVLVESKESSTSGSVFAFSLETKTISKISSADQLPQLQLSEAVLVHGDLYLVPGGDFSDAFGGEIIAINAIDGTRSVLSDNSIGSGDLYGGTGYSFIPLLTGIAKDEKSNRLFVFEYWTNRIFTVDLTTFNRKIFSNIAYNQVGIIGVDVGSLDMKIDEQQQLLILADYSRKAIIIVDIETGEKAILSKSTDTRN